MLSSVWKESRATEDSETNSLSSRHSDGVRSIMSRHDGVINAPPAARMTDPPAEKEDDAEKKPEKLEKFEVDETQGGGSEDRRPAVFKSTLWEVLAVATLVSAQLTNVTASSVYLTSGIGPYTTDNDSCID